MKKSKFSEEQIVEILREGEKGEVTVEKLCRKHGLPKQIYYGWKRKYTGLGGEELQRLKQLVQENARLKRALAEAVLDNQILKQINGKNGRASGTTGNGAMGRQTWNQVSERRAAELVGIRRSTLRHRPLGTRGQHMRNRYVAWH